MLSPQIKNKARCLLSPVLFNTVLELPDWTVRQKKPKKQNKKNPNKIKGIPIVK